jgi:hypothetical protein
MTSTKLADHLSRVRQRKQELGLDDTTAAVEAMRNRGGERTPEKRALLAAASERSEAAGRKPVRAYF